MDGKQIEAILRFCFMDTDEVRGHSPEMLPPELLNKLRRFAAGKLKRNELEEFSERVASNSAAILMLADEIEQYWGQHRDTNDWAGRSPEI
jgi:hypothetical protein